MTLIYRGKIGHAWKYHRSYKLKHCTTHSIPTPAEIVLVLLNKYNENIRKYENKIYVQWWYLKIINLTLEYKCVSMTESSSINSTFSTAVHCAAVMLQCCSYELVPVQVTCDHADHHHVSSVSRVSRGQWTNCAQTTCSQGSEDTWVKIILYIVFIIFIIILIICHNCLQITTSVVFSIPFLLNTKSWNS